MIIVVEGPDGAGKSTLIDNLRLSSGRHYLTLRRSGPPKDVGEISNCVRWVEKAVNSLILVLDRHPLISESIYGDTLRGSNLLNGTYNHDDIKEHLLGFVDRVIYCRPPTSVIMQKMYENLQLKGVTSKIEEITQRYDYTMRLIKHWGVRVVEYDWTAEHEAESWNLNELFFGGDR